MPVSTTSSSNRSTRITSNSTDVPPRTLSPSEALTVAANPGETSRGGGIVSVGSGVGIAVAARVSVGSGVTVAAAAGRGVGCGVKVDVGAISLVEIGAARGAVFALDATVGENA